MLAQQGKTDEHESSVALVSEPRHLSRSAHADSACTSKTTSVTTLAYRPTLSCLRSRSTRGKGTRGKNAPTHGLDLKFGKEAEPAYWPVVGRTAIRNFAATSKASRYRHGPATAS